MLHCKPDLMTRFTSFIFFIVVAFVLIACNGRKQKLVGTWHVIKWENPYNDSFFRNAQNYIDTIGKEHDAATNMQIYGISNMDSLRHELQLQFDSARAVQENAATKTTFIFKKDGTAEVHIDTVSNTGKWLLDDENALILEETGFGNKGAVSKYQIVGLSDDELVLRFYEESDSSTVTFRREGK